MSFLERVEDVVGGGDVGFTTGERFGDAEKSDNIGAVGVKVLAMDVSACFQRWTSILGTDRALVR